MLAALIWQSSEIQKILAFDGIFKELFLVVTREGGLESQSVVTDALRCVDTLLLFNRWCHRTSCCNSGMKTRLPMLV